MPLDLDFAGIFQLSPSPTIVLDRALRCVAANEAYLRATGRRRADLIGRDPFDVLPRDPSDPGGDDAIRLRESLARVLATGLPDAVVLEPDGERHWSATHTPVLDEHGETAYVLQHIADTTQLERLKRLDGERLAMLEAIPQQIWTARPDGQLDFVNVRVLEYFGATAAQILGAGWQDVIAPDDLPRAIERWTHSLRTGDSYEVEFRLRGRDGVYRWHLGRALALRDRAGTISKWFGTNTDIDEARRARDELERRAEYEQQLIGIVSHDLRNPLSAIAMAASLLLRRGSLDERQSKAIARIVSSTQRAARLIGDFMDFAQARSATGIPITPATAQLRDITSQITDELRLAHPERDVRTEYLGDLSGPWDPDRIAQVIGNLVGNAFQHGAPDAPVRIVAQGYDDHVLFSVQNQGPPLPADDIARLFQPFQRGRDNPSPTGRGIGLGLYISREIVIAHGGGITVESTAEAGTTFTVRLPR